MKAIDRGVYVDDSPYQDSPQPIGFAATISAPHMHGYALEHLSKHLLPGARALDVGSGSGYLTLAMAHMVGEGGVAVGIEHIPELVDYSISRTKEHYGEMLDSGRVKFLAVDGFDGYPEGGPYDVIHVGAAAPRVPRALVEQLKPGGRMFIPVGPDGGAQEIVLVDKDQEGNVHKRNIMGVRYVPLTSRDKQMATFTRHRGY
mmetsp:Transcript_9894/g.31140  ORF Transcript_9894/g.31140 Transcript_9894/m.31140 type:complete len:202 (-) Transcript_9894:82-687(-)